jgi:hypothetical protein
MSIATRNGLVTLVLLLGLVFAVRRRSYGIALILGFLVLDFAADLLTLWFAPGTHHAIRVWLDKHGSGP